MTERCAKHGCHAWPTPGTIYCDPHHYPGCASRKGEECDCHERERAADRDRLRLLGSFFGALS